MKIILSFFAEYLGDLHGGDTILGKVVEIKHLLVVVHFFVFFVYGIGLVEGEPSLIKY